MLAKMKWRDYVIKKEHCVGAMIQNPLAGSNQYQVKKKLQEVL